MTDAVQVVVIIAAPTLLGICNVVATLITNKKLKEVHTIVNSGATEQLRVGMVSAQTLAETTKNPEHIRLAGVAEEKYSQARHRELTSRI